MSYRDVGGVDIPCGVCLRDGQTHSWSFHCTDQSLAVNTCPSFYVYAWCNFLCQLMFGRSSPTHQASRLGLCFSRRCRPSGRCCSQRASPVAGWSAVKREILKIPFCFCSPKEHTMLSFPRMFTESKETPWTACPCAFCLSPRASAGPRRTCAVGRMSPRCCGSWRPPPGRREWTHTAPARQVAANTVGNVCLKSLFSVQTGCHIHSHWLLV